MSRLSPFPRPSSRLSIAESDTTYYTVHEARPSEVGRAEAQRLSKQQQDAAAPTSSAMHRQDSGYESLASKQKSASAHVPRRRTTSRSITRRTSNPRPRSSRSTESPLLLDRYLSSYSPSPSEQRHDSQQVTAWSYFPPLEDHVDCQSRNQEDHRDHSSRPRTASHRRVSRPGNPDASNPPTAAPRHEIPPASTHYWTSDRTRRLEYAAIDAASRGVKAWMLRHMVPDCFVPRERRHLGFDDDSGSVRRYRLDLGQEGSVAGDAEKEMRERGRWPSRGLLGGH